MGHRRKRWACAWGSKQPSKLQKKTKRLCTAFLLSPLGAMGVLGFACCPLLIAEENGFYSDIGFEFSRMQSTQTSNYTPQALATDESHAQLIPRDLFKSGLSQAEIDAAADKIGVVEQLVKNIDPACAGGQTGCLVNLNGMKTFVSAYDDASEIATAVSVLLTVFQDTGATFQGDKITGQNIGDVLYALMEKNDQLGGGTGPDFNFFNYASLMSIVHLSKPLGVKDFRALFADIYWLFYGGSEKSLLGTFGSQLSQKNPFASASAFQNLVNSATQITDIAHGLNRVLASDITSMSTKNPKGLEDLLSYWKTLGANPFASSIGILQRFINTGSNNGRMMGLDVQFGYKQFFGTKRRFGLRYYEFFSWQHGSSTWESAGLNNFTYGGGIDMLYNLYESKSGKFSAGLFAGLIFAGKTWDVSNAKYWRSLEDMINANGGKAKIDMAYFQMPLNLGFRTNMGKHGFEVGVRLPLMTEDYFKGTIDGFYQKVIYTTKMTVFFNYLHNF